MLYLLRQANAAVQQAVDRELEGLGLSLPQYSALTMIAAYDGLSGADLSRLSMLTPQSANETIKRLESAGMITRQADPRHGRIIQLHISPKGRELLSKARSRTDRVEEFLRTIAGSMETDMKEWLVEIATRLTSGEPLLDRRMSRRPRR